MTRKKNLHSGVSPTPCNDLTEEIRILRAIIHQVARQAELARSAEGCEPVDLQEVLHSIGEASTHLATLLRAQQEFTSGDDLPGALHQALENILAEIEREGEAGPIAPVARIGDGGQENPGGPA